LRPYDDQWAYLSSFGRYRGTVFRTPTTLNCQADLGRPDAGPRTNMPTTWKCCRPSYRAARLEARSREALRRWSADQGYSDRRSFRRPDCVSSCVWQRSKPGILSRSSAMRLPTYRQAADHLMLPASSGACGSATRLFFDEAIELIRSPEATAILESTAR